MDSVYQSSIQHSSKTGDKYYEPEKYKSNFDNLDIQTQTHTTTTTTTSDTIKKERLFLGVLKMQ